MLGCEKMTNYLIYSSLLAGVSTAAWAIIHYQFTHAFVSASTGITCSLTTAICLWFLKKFGTYFFHFAKDILMPVYDS